MADPLPPSLAALNDIRINYLRAAVEIIMEAGKIVSRAYYEVKKVSGKDSITDLVTETDKLVETFIFDSLKKRFPNHSFIGEESVSDGASSLLTDNPTWIVDPIDGTCNFVHRFPYVAISIGLVINKKVEVGLVLAPMLNDMYIAVRGKGAYLNKVKLNVDSSPASLASALVASEWGASREATLVSTKGQNFMASILKHGIHGMRSTGSAALNMCLVASGSFDLYFEWGPHCWDVAAGALLVEESGGTNTTTKGEPFDLMGRTIVCAKAKHLIDELVPNLIDIPTPRDD